MLSFFFFSFFLLWFLLNPPTSSLSSNWASSYRDNTNIREKRKKGNSRLPFDWWDEGKHWSRSTYSRASLQMDRQERKTKLCALLPSHHLFNCTVRSHFDDKLCFYRPARENTNKEGRWISILIMRERESPLVDLGCFITQTQGL